MVWRESWRKTQRNCRAQDLDPSPYKRECSTEAKADPHNNLEHFHHRSWSRNGVFKQNHAPRGVPGSLVEVSTKVPAWKSDDVRISNGLE